MRVLIVIPARGGSTRIPRKNMQIVGGMTLVYRALEQAEEVCWKRAGLNGNRRNGTKLWAASTHVNTDCARVAMECLQYDDVYDGPNHGWCVHARQCEPDGPMAAVLLDSLSQAGEPHYTYQKGPPLIVACVQPTSPLRLPDDIEGCIELLVSNPEARSAVTVDETTGKRNGACYATRVEMLRDGLVFDDDSLKYPMPASRSLDINTPSDLEEARRILGP